MMWEPMDIGNPCAERLKVPGGWIVRSIYCAYKSGGGIHQLFISDPEHLWELK